MSHITFYDYYCNFCAILHFLVCYDYCTRSEETNICTQFAFIPDFLTISANQLIDYTIYQTKRSLHDQFNKIR